MDEKMKVIAQAIFGMKYSEWCRIREAIEKAFASERMRVKLNDPEAIEDFLKLGL